MATVNDILMHPFSQRPLEEQVRIVLGGRPCPKLRVHVPSIYDEETWLCGCDKRNGFFCWICMLFVPQKSKWNISGFYAHKNLMEEMKLHRYSENHMNGMLQYQVFLQTNIRTTPAGIPKQNSYLKKLNREALKRLIDIVCTVVLQISPCAAETVVPELPKMCSGMLNFLKPYDDPEIVSEAIRIVEMNPAIVTDIIGLTASIMKKEIVKDLKSSTFVSVIFSGHRDVRQQKKYSVVVRYIKDGEVYERLVGFSAWDDRSLILIVNQVVNELEISDKFLGFSCDGIIAPVKNLHDFLLTLSHRYPNTFFVPWHLHEFHSVLLQSAIGYPSVDVFVRTLKSIREYFESSPANCKAFHQSCYAEVLDLSHLKMTDSQFLRVLKMYRNHFVTFFSSLARDDTGRCTSIDAFTAEGYAKALQDPHFVFILELFFQLFQYTAYVNEMLASNSPDCVFEWYTAAAILDALRKQKEGGYTRLFALFTNEITNNNPKKLQTLVETGEIKFYFLGIFQDILTKLMKAIQLRYKHVKKLQFLGIFDCENLQKFALTRNYFKNLIESPVPFFVYRHLVEEVKCLVNYDQLLARKSVFEMVQLFRQKKLNEILKNCYKLAELIITLPCKPVHSDNPVTKLDSINSWISCSFSSQAECLSLLNIENDFLKYLKSKLKFYDLVILELDALSNLMGKNGKTNSIAISTNVKNK